MEFIKTYTVPQVAAETGLSKAFLYGEIKAGRLKAKKPTGRSRGYRMTEEIFNDWWNNEMEDPNGTK